MIGDQGMYGGMGSIKEDIDEKPARWSVGALSLAPLVAAEDCLMVCSE